MSTITVVVGEQVELALLPEPAKSETQASIVFAPSWNGALRVLRLADLIAVDGQGEKPNARPPETPVQAGAGRFTGKPFTLRATSDRPDPMSEALSE